MQAEKHSTIAPTVQTDDFDRRLTGSLPGVCEMIVAAGASRVALTESAAAIDFVIGWFQPGPEAEQSMLHAAAVFALLSCFAREAP